jgi:hypothetical protein
MTSRFSQNGSISKIEAIGRYFLSALVNMPRIGNFFME